MLGFLAFTLTWGMFLETVSLDSPDAERIGLRLTMDIVAGLAMIVLYALRHRFPRVAPYLVLALAAFSVLGAPAAAAMMVSVAARRRPVHTAVFAVLFFVVSSIDVTVYPFPDETPLWQLLTVGAIVTAALVLFGLLVGARRQLRQTQAEQQAAAEAARQRQVEQALVQARSHERSRIAREMHDVLGHRLSLMAVHAGALEYRRDLTPEQTVQTAGVIRENTTLALDELREILGVLREEDPDQPLSAPQPNAADIAALVEEARAAGGVIVVERLECDAIPDAIGRHLYRIVQEALTNARRHAPGEALTLRLDCDDSGVRLTARNAVRAAREDGSADEPPAHGFGLTGIAERVRLAGGAFTADAHAGVFELSAVIPWQS